MGSTLNPSEWLNLGLGGAALFLLLVFIVMFMKNSTGKNNDIQSLCGKIDRLVDSNAETVKTLATSLTQWNLEQKATSSNLDKIEGLTQIQSGKLDRIEGKLDSILGLKKEDILR